MYFDREVQPITRRQWYKLIKEPDYKIVKQTELSNGKFVSTVWLGLDHAVSDDQLPVIFEIVVFSNKNREKKEYLERHRSEYEALVEHEFICECWSKL